MAMVFESVGVGPMEGLNQLIGTRQQLVDFIDVATTEVDGDKQLRNSFCIEMGGLLAVRMGEGVTPEQYVQAVAELIEDCTSDAKTDRVTKERLPWESSGAVQARYDHFAGVESVMFAGAFGDGFARAVQAINTASVPDSAPEMI